MLRSGESGGELQVVCSSFSQGSEQPANYEHAPHAACYAVLSS